MLLSKNAQNDLKFLPASIVEKVHRWIKLVNRKGIREVRMIKGFHDEPLKGKRHGQRSVRINYYYRLIYTEDADSMKLTIEVLEVNKHEY